MQETEKIDPCKATIQGCFSMLKNVCAVADGPKLMLEQSSDADIQEMVSGIGHMTTELVIVLCLPQVLLSLHVSNTPGTLQDSNIAEW